MRFYQTDLFTKQQLTIGLLFLTLILMGQGSSLAEGVTPRDWARPGVDPMAKLQLLMDTGSPEIVQ